MVSFWIAILIKFYLLMIVLACDNMMFSVTSCMRFILFSGLFFVFSRAVVASVVHKSIFVPQRLSWFVELNASSPIATEYKPQDLQSPAAGLL
jgi:hypothetical protein